MKTIRTIMMMMKNKRVLVGLSGGVDSAACVLLLQEQGYEVEGVFLHLKEDDAALPGAREMAGHLQIPLRVLDLRSFFEEEIISFFIEGYAKGETPNPCVRCNRRVKFGKMLDYALEEGFDFIATGHYARVVHEESRSRILMGSNKRKDQSYVLYTLSDHQRLHILLPLGEIENKEQTRELLKERGIPLHAKKESQEICFVADDYRDFLMERGFVPETGNFIDEQGNVLGQHKGVGFYTLGQRKGLGISAPTPLFVKEIRVGESAIVLSQEEALKKDHVYLRETNFFEGKIPKEGVRAKIRYSASPAQCRVSKDERGIRVDFETPVRAATPGQSLVLYRGEELIGGGIIDPA